MRKFAVLSCLSIAALTTSAPATVVYQTVQPTSVQSAQYHTFITQISGNASQNFGDEIRLGNGTTDRTLTSIVVPTQTFQSPPTPAYTPAFLELRLWPNDGPVSADGTTPDGNPNPGVLPFAVARVAGPTYPAGGNHDAATNRMGIPVTFTFGATSVYNYTGAVGGDALFVNNLNLPEQFTVTIVNLNSDGVQDGLNPAGNQFGPYLSGGTNGATAAQSNTDPDANPLTQNNNTLFNTNEVGTSRTGPVVNLFTSTGHWLWNQSNGSAPGTGWGDSRSQNLVMSMTINAVPEPASFGIVVFAGAAALTARRRR